MSSAYGENRDDQKEDSLMLTSKQLNLPVYYHSKEIQSREFILDCYNEADFDGLFEIFEEIIEDGQSYPQLTTDSKQFRQYFLSHHCFVINEIINENKISDPSSSSSSSSRSKSNRKNVVAGFYIKPNFPGRSSHLANYGLIVASKHRNLGLGKFMGKECIRLARLLGFKALYTNLVYANNRSSISICQCLGFRQYKRE
ncbi:hypothetical protein SSS_01707 [Sarcoptes scabiei]|uniref:L-azetidine-2-carboxylic acid acetyltransferase n=1 Tax=Sarcoptes scabiei TaxID=52283 RepID=A0A834REC4_SARSC|nr:hypothetical protein SSS_01707 [Sarcoptes scabiei]